MKYLCSLLLIFVLILSCSSSPQLSVTKDQIDFGPAGVTASFKVVNAGGGKMDWNITYNAPWISTLPKSGLTEKDSIDILVKVDRTKLNPGKFTTSLDIRSDGGDTSIIVTVIRYDNPIVRLTTNMGIIDLELFPDVAPGHVANFMKLIASGFYNGLVFHRVIDGFMIQAGAFDAAAQFHQADMINAEFNDSLHHAGTLAMARAQLPNSASSQFYICLGPRPQLDHQYTVFGKTIRGFDVVQAIGKVETSGKRGNPPNWPIKPVIIEKAEIIKDFIPIK